MAALIEKRNEFISQCYGGLKGLPKPFPGWSDMSLFSTINSEYYVKTNGRLGAVIGSPLNWNVKILRDKEVLPGVGKKG